MKKRATFGVVCTLAFVTGAFMVPMGIGMYVGLAGGLIAGGVVVMALACLADLERKAREEEGECDD